MGGVGVIEIGSVVWGVRDIARAVSFWSAALDYRLKYPASEDWAILVPREGPGTQLSLNLVSSPHARRHHIDLFADDQKAEVQRLIALGTSPAAWDYPADADYVVLHDPDGNPFCVVQR